MNYIGRVFSLLLLIFLYLLIEIIGKKDYIKIKEAFILKSKNNITGLTLAKDYLEEHNINPTIKTGNGAFDDDYDCFKNTLYISCTGCETPIIISICSVMRATVKADLYQQNKTYYKLSIIVLNILKTLTLVTVPCLVISLFSNNDNLVYASVIVYIVYILFAISGLKKEKEISNKSIEYIEKKGIFGDKELDLFRMTNTISEKAIFNSTFNSFKQIMAIVAIIFKKQTKKL